MIYKVKVLTRFFSEMGFSFNPYKTGLFVSEMGFGNLGLHGKKYWLPSILTYVLGLTDVLSYWRLFLLTNIMEKF